MIYVNARAIVERVNNGKTEVLVQWRDKKGQKGMYEFPGGRVEPFESFFDALKREVKEETGLDVIAVTGQESLFTTKTSHEWTVECFQPYAVYQTVEGPVDAMGVYFKCRAEGTPLSKGDDTKDIKWISLDELQALLDTEGLLSNSSVPAALLYLNEQNSNN